MPRAVIGANVVACLGAGERNAARRDWSQCRRMTWRRARTRTKRKKRQHEAQEETPCGEGHHPRGQFEPAMQKAIRKQFCAMRRFSATQASVVDPKLATTLQFWRPAVLLLNIISACFSFALVSAPASLLKVWVGPVPFASIACSPTLLFCGVAGVQFQFKAGDWHRRR